MAISASVVKELRDRTGLGMMDCKKALLEADGDIEAAIEVLRKSSGMKAAKKAGRIAADGMIGAKIEGGKGVIVEVNCETDFAAKDAGFQTFVSTVTNKIFEMGRTDIDLLGIEPEREALVQKIGENISIRRADLFDGEDKVVEYIHTNGKIGVLIAMEGGTDELGKDVAMHIAAMNPIVVSPADAPADLLSKERDIYAAQAQDSGKPPEIIEKMIDGRIKKYLSEISLLEQAFVKDSDKNVGKLLESEGSSVSRFVRFEVGEGIEKEEEDFAAEVNKQLGN